MSATEKGKGGGVLPINAAATRKIIATQNQAKGAQRQPATRLRLIIRRLPPGLAENEFWTALGEEWHLAKGKIDWAVYKDGKISKDPSKPSRPARAYLKVKDQSMLDGLSMEVKQANFVDAKRTDKDSCLLGPPSLEFAPYSKMHSTRVRHDGRQGTIDQDQEFIDFLQSLTEPITKASANGVDPAEARLEKVTTTPLVQYLKEKKANKAKEAAEKKSKAKQEAKEGKPGKGESKSPVVVKGSTAAAEKARVAKATQDAVKAINKSVASMKDKQAPAKSDTKADSKEAPPSPAKRERERGNASAAARMLQRDLGLTPKSPRAARATSASSAATKTEAASEEKPNTPTTEPKSSSATPSTTSAVPPTGPRSSRPPTAPSTPTTATSAAAPATPRATPAPPAQRPSKPLPNPSANAKSAFLKHANPSQGVTEDLLRTAFAAFGTVTRCEIDKKKGLGYIDFEDTETLRKAMHASPVKVGNGQVVVLENRNQNRPPKAQGAAQPVKATSAASMMATTATAAATASGAASPTIASPIATSAMPAVSYTPSSPTVTPAEAATTPTTITTTAPTAPRASSRGGPRGGVRGATTAARGSFAATPRGAPRGGFRGARGAFGPHGRGGPRVAGAGAAAKPTAASGDGATTTAIGGGGGGAGTAASAISAGDGK